MTLPATGTAAPERPLRILVVCQYFHPENFRINDLAAGLVEKGHEVDVVTGTPNYPQGRFFEGYGWFRRTRETFRGVRVFRLPLLPRGRGGALGLALNYLSFAVLGTLLAPWAVRGRPYDIVLANQLSPVTGVLPGVLMRRLRKVPMIMIILDLWPETLLATGAVQSRRALHLIDIVIRFIYRHCDRILVQSRGFFGSLIERGVPQHAIRYFPTSAEDIFRKGETAGAGKPVLPGTFNVVFAGNIGDAQDFETILDAAAMLQDLEGFALVVLGDGRRYDWVREQVARRALTSVHLLGRRPLDEMPGYFTAAQALLVTLKKEPVYALTIPGKVQSYLASAVPIVAALDGEGARVIGESQAGLVVAAGDAAGLAQAVRLLHRMRPEERARMGASGVQYFEQNFARDMLIDRLIGWMRELLAQTQAPPGARRP